MKLSGYHNTISSYKTFISDFWFQWPNVRSILWPPHCKAMGEKSNRSFTMNWVVLGYCWWYSRKFWSMTFIKAIRGHMTLSEVTNRFLLISHDSKELQTWAWSHWACLVKTHCLICNMTYLGQHVTFVWLWPEVEHWPFRLRSPGTCFDGP